MGMMRCVWSILSAPTWLLAQSGEFDLPDVVGETVTVKISLGL